MSKTTISRVKTPEDLITQFIMGSMAEHSKAKGKGSQVKEKDLQNFKSNLTKLLDKTAAEASSVSTQAAEEVARVFSALQNDLSNYAAKTNKLLAGDNRASTQLHHQTIATIQALGDTGISLLNQIGLAKTAQVVKEINTERLKLKEQELQAAQETRDEIKRQALEKAEQTRIATEKAEQTRIAMEKAAQTRIATEQANLEKLAQQKAATERAETIIQENTTPESNKSMSTGSPILNEQQLLTAFIKKSVELYAEAKANNTPLNNQNLQYALRQNLETRIVLSSQLDPILNQLINLENLASHIQKMDSELGTVAKANDQNNPYHTIVREVETNKKSGWQKLAEFFENIPSIAAFCKKQDQQNKDKAIDRIVPTGIAATFKEHMKPINKTTAVPTNANLPNKKPDLDTPIR